MLLFPGLWFSHTGELVSVELVVQPSSESSLARVQILRPYCSPNQHLVPPCHSLLNAFSCCSALALCNTTGGCSLGRYWCPLLEACVPNARPCSTYDTTVRSRGFTSPPRYPAPPPFYHLVADMPLSIKPSVTVYPDDVVAVQHTRDSGAFLHCLEGDASAGSPWRQSFVTLRGAEWGGWWEGGLTSLPRGSQWVDGAVCNLRVLYEDLFTAKVQSGFPVKFTWVIDNLEKSAQEGESYSIMFEKPAEHELQVVASNPVSSQSLQILLTADVRTPLTEPDFLFDPEAVAVNVPHLYNVRVKVDVSLPVTFWDFGDGSEGAIHTHSAPCQDMEGLVERGEKHVYVQDSVNHTYSIPSIKPSTSGVLYTWDFGDASKFVQGFHRKVSHSFESAGVYNVTVATSNTVPSLTASLVVVVVEGISGLTVTYNGPSEAGSPVDFRATVASGTDLIWDFDFGDGSLWENLTDGSISHVYKFSGSYRVAVKVSNSVSQAYQSITAEVYDLTVSGVLPKECVMSGKAIQLSALVNGNISALSFHWAFGQDSPSIVMTGQSTVMHIFPNHGIFHINITVFSSFTTVSFRTSICVESPITHVEMEISQDVVAIGEEVCLRVLVSPKQTTAYTFRWFNTSSGLFVTTERSRRCFVFRSEGVEEVSVLATNRMSNKTANATITVQKPVGKPRIIRDSQGEKLTVNTSTSFGVASCVGSNVSMLWDFGDGSPVENKRNVSHVFTSTGKFTVTTTAFNLVSRDSATLTVNVLLPVSDLSLRTDQPYAVVGQEIVVTAVSSTISITNYYWTVEGRTATKQGTYQFRFMSSKPGVFKVKVMSKNLVSKMEAAIFIEVFERIEGLQVECQSLTNNKYLPTHEDILFGASVAKGSNITYHWDATQSGVTWQIQGDGELFHMTVESPGRISVQVKASNILGEGVAHASLVAVDRVTKAHIATQSNTVVLGKAVNMTVLVEAGSDLQYIWYVNADSSLLTHVPFLLYTFTNLGHNLVTVSVQNVFSQSNYTKQLLVQAEVQEVGFEINRQKHPFFVNVSASLSFHGFAHKGSDLHWVWKVRSVKKTLLTSTNPAFTYSFSDTGIYEVYLNVSNEISWQMIFHDVVVQEPIEGLLLNISKTSLCTQEQVVFSPTITKGNNVSFVIMFQNKDWIQSWDIFEDRFTTISLLAGKHLVTVKALNQVSSAETHSSIVVTEIIRGLRLVNCCFATLEALKGAPLKAEVQSGFPVNYTWTFQLESGGSMWLVGQDVVFTPSESGLLSVTVHASNGVCSQTINDTLTIEWPVKNVKLVCHSQRIFAGHAVRFSATVNCGSNVRYIWDFGDSTEILATSSWDISHLYHSKGKYGILVKALNNVSHVSTQLEVEVEELQCPSPRVSLVQIQPTVFRSRPNLFEAAVDINCSAYKTVYLWEIFRVACFTNETKVSQRTQKDAASPLLLLPKNTLDVGHYCLVFTVFFKGTPLLVQQKTNITVVHSLLVAVIEGGSHRLWPSVSDLIIDGSESYDPDVELGMEDVLEYHWACLMMNSTESPLMKQSIESTNKRMIILRSQLRPGTVCIFNLTVFKNGRRPSSANQTYKWRAEDQSGLPLDLNDITTSTGRRSPKLVVRSSVLQSGRSYSFVLNVSQPGSMRWGGASLTIQASGLPRDGVCELSPESQIQLLETVVTYSCSWHDDDSETSQLIYTFQVAPFQPSSPVYRVLTLYDQADDQWIRNKSQTELWALVQHANPQEIIPYSIALISKLNQAEELANRREIRENATQALVSVPVSSLQDVDQLSSALTQSTTSALSHAGALMRAFVHSRVLGDAAILFSNSYIKTLGFHGDPLDLLCSHQSNQSNRNPTSRSSSAEGFKSSPLCPFLIPTSLSAHLRRQSSEVVQVWFCVDGALESNPLLSAADPPISTTVAAMELTTPQGQPIPIQDLDPEQAIRVTLLSVCIFSSLCQYYDVKDRRWRSEGLRSLEGSTLHTTLCLAQHLTMFGASLFLHPGAVVLLPPCLQADEPMQNMVVGIVCAVLVALHLLVGLIAHKLDHLDRVRLSQVPLCGRPGLYHYRVLVKTGLRPGATTAHVGICLYGVSKSGSRHLQRDGAFQRCGLDQFQVETDDNLGEIWKIRIWHDNTLDPSWYIQHVVVWDPQTDHMFFFVLEEWLSVANQKNSTVEREVLASPEELTQFRRVFTSQLIFGMAEGNLWLSVWERPAHSSFTRGQRVACSALMLHLYLALGTLWFGAVGMKNHVARGQPGWFLPPWVLRVVYPLITFLIGACLAVVGLYGSLFSKAVLLMWLVSALTAFFTSIALLEPLKACVQALICAVLWGPVDPEVEELLAQETTVVRTSGVSSRNIRPPCGYGLLQAKEEARKTQALRSLMRFLLLVLMVNYQDRLEQTQARLLCSTVRQLLHTAPAIDFTQRHRESGVFLCVSVRLEPTGSHGVASFLSVRPLLAPPSLSAPDLRVALTLQVFLLVSALVLQVGELRAAVRERAQCIRRRHRWFQLLLSCLSLATAVLQLRSLVVIVRMSSRVRQAEVFQLAMEPHDYEMVEFFIKRLKLWMGLTKAKQFRHRVKFEGMDFLPSRSSRESCFSSLSPTRPSPQSPSSSPSIPSPRPLSCVGPEDLSLFKPRLEVRPILDSLEPTVSALLSRFDRVNQLTEDIYDLELQLEKAQDR
uniref:Polycystic kidney disease 1b n=1 Tax=Kryptolebias marmoratus TaxID=37003 RepID=A0A3Q2ZEU2_KRYMA